MWFWMNMNDDWSLAAGAARVNHKKVSGSAVGGSGISSRQLQATPTWLPRTDLPPVRDLTFAQASHLQPVTSCDRLPPPGCSQLLLLTNLWYIFAPAHHSAWRWKSSKKKWYLSLSHWHGFPLNFCSAWAVSNKPSGFASDCRQSGRPKSTRRDDDGYCCNRLQSITLLYSTLDQRTHNQPLFPLVHIFLLCLCFLLKISVALIIIWLMWLSLCRLLRQKHLPLNWTEAQYIQYGDVFHIKCIHIFHIKCIHHTRIHRIHMYTHVYTLRGISLI